MRHTVDDQMKNDGALRSEHDLTLGLLLVLYSLRLLLGVAQWSGG